MSRTAPERFETWTLHLPCRRCGAQPGIWCRTRTGVWASHLHGVREDVVGDIFRAGLAEGRADERVRHAQDGCPLADSPATAAKAHVARR